MKDIRAAIDDMHVGSNKLKTTCLASPQKYIKRDERLPALLKKLLKNEKKTFLLTNSDWWFTNKIMTFLVGSSWSDYFTLVVVDACKPRFFSSSSEMVKLEPEGQRVPVYSGGDQVQVTTLLGSTGQNIIYWGDHLYADIVQCGRLSLWRTALIVPEMDWSHLTSMANTNIFRCQENPTYYTNNMENYADIYTGSVCNLLNYKLDWTFSPRLCKLPHEHKRNL